MPPFPRSESASYQPPVKMSNRAGLIVGVRPDRAPARNKGNAERFSVQEGVLLSRVATGAIMTSSALTNDEEAGMRAVSFSVRVAIVTVVTFAVPSPALRKCAAQVDSSDFADLKWRSIGPPRSGYVSAPAGIPGDPTTYYAGMPEGGVWKTTNAGNTWRPVFDDVHVASVGAVAVAPSERNTVYVGTGDRSGWAFTPGKGVFKSADA